MANPKESVSYIDLMGHYILENFQVEKQVEWDTCCFPMAIDMRDFSLKTKQMILKVYLQLFKEDLSVQKPVRHILEVIKITYSTVRVNLSLSLCISREFFKTAKWERVILNGKNRKSPSRTSTMDSLTKIKNIQVMVS